MTKLGNTHTWIGRSIIDDGTVRRPDLVLARSHPQMQTWAFFMGEGREKKKKKVIAYTLAT